MSWSGCSATCGKGTKTRNRVCKLAIQGGAECPSQEEAPGEYKETKECFEKKCSGIIGPT